MTEYVLTGSYTSNEGTTRFYLGSYPNLESAEVAKTEHINEDRPWRCRYADLKITKR